MSRHVFYGSTTRSALRYCCAPQIPKLQFGANSCCLLHKLENSVEVAGLVGLARTFINDNLQTGLLHTVKYAACSRTQGRKDLLTRFAGGNSTLRLLNYPELPLDTFVADEMPDERHPEGDGTPLASGRRELEENGF